MSRLNQSVRLLGGFVAVLLLVCAPLASAANFNQNNIINDLVFDNAGTMSPGQIDTFLNNFPGSCISLNSGFKAIDPTGYNPSQGYVFGGYTSAGQVIYDAAQAYGLNPQVLLVTLEKEQSLVTGRNNFSGYCNNGDQHKYTAAVGYGCPDSGTTYSYTGLNLYQRNGVTVSDTGTTCVNSAVKAGFSQQVIRAAWLLKFGEQRSKGNINWAVVKGNWNNSDDPQSCYGGPMTQGTWQRCPSGGSAYYDGYTTIDGSATHMDDGATAALYWYTPHFSGNTSFFNLFTGWFGSTYTSSPYAWNLTSVRVYGDANYQNVISNLSPLTLAPGQKAYIKVLAHNVGYNAWDSHTHLAVINPITRTSPFSDSSWLSADRPAAMQSATTAPDNDAVFQFSVTAPSSPGSFTESYGLVQDGTTFMNDAGLRLQIDVVQPVAGGSSTVISTLHSGQAATSALAHHALYLQPDGNLVLSVNLKPVWSSNTAGSGATYFINQADGNMVLYSASGKPVWASNTNGSGATSLQLQPDGNLVSYGTNGVVWASNTNTSPQENSQVNESMSPGFFLLPGEQLQTPDRKYSLFMQADGNLVLYNLVSGKALWASNTNGKSVMFLALQADGNLVLYGSTGQPLWSSNTNGTGGSNLFLQEDGNLVLYSPSRAVWATNTQGH